MTTAGHDPDDWFDEPDVPDAWTTRVDRLARARQAQPAPTPELDDWISPPPAEPARREHAYLRRPAVILVALGLALLFGILAAAGVFSRGTSNPTAPVTTPATQPAHTTTSATTTKLPTYVVPSATLKPGDSGTAVKQLQRTLKHLGYSPGTIDGSYGDGTKSAVSRFQQAHGLTADGVAGSQTLAALTSALRSG